ncbi:MAG: aspartyl-tRNA(Asn)/glutamyl-tRNA(Gln) amidotransferase subunit C [Parvicellaceae bacterium]|jgi:aspartyl-tRNA(Asn)/glutamyl-tRNA(Gln) amidotransferase subunit C
MIIDDKIVDKIATLSKLKFEGEAKENMKADMNKMLDFVSKLDEIDTEGIEPLVYMTDEVNVLREDDAYNPITQKEGLKNAPKKDSDYFRVPKVLSK